MASVKMPIRTSVNKAGARCKNPPGAEDTGATRFPNALADEHACFSAFSGRARARTQRGITLKIVEGRHASSTRHNGARRERHERRRCHIH
jgi:hypothetical protein